MSIADDIFSLCTSSSKTLQECFAVGLFACLLLLYLNFRDYAEIYPSVNLFLFNPGWNQVSPYNLQIIIFFYYLPVFALPYVLLSFCGIFIIYILALSSISLIFFLYYDYVFKYFYSHSSF